MLSYGCSTDYHPNSSLGSTPSNAIPSAVIPQTAAAAMPQQFPTKSCDVDPYSSYNNWSNGYQYASCPAAQPQYPSHAPPGAMLVYPHV